MKRCKPGCTCGKHSAPGREENKRRNAEGVRAAWTPEGRRAQSERSTAMWQDEAHRDRISKSRQGMRGKKPAKGSCRSGNYIYLTGQKDHPLAHRGNVAEHRKVLYDKIGPGPHPCHWKCGKILQWDRWHLVSDHLDGDTFNNNPDNLVPSCQGCNMRRAKAGNPINWVVPT